MTYQLSPNGGEVTPIDLSTIVLPDVQKRGENTTVPLPEVAHIIPLARIDPKDLVNAEPPNSGQQLATGTASKEEKEEKGKTPSAPESAPLPLLPLSIPAEAPAVTSFALPENDDVFTAAPTSNPVLNALKDSGFYVRKAGTGQHVVTCPWASEHGSGERSDAIYFEQTVQRPLGVYVCPCSHAEPPRLDRFLARLSIDESKARLKPRIRIMPGEMVRIIDRSEQVLNALGGYYQSGGAIVTIKKMPGGDVISVPMTEQALLKALALASDWEKYDGTARGWRRCDPTVQIAKQLLSAQVYEHFPALDHIARQPFFRTDGLLVTEPGYDPVSRTFAAFAGRACPPVSSSAVAAKEALEKLRALLTEFQFASEVDRSAALCAILTAAARSSLPLAPAFNVTASTPGSGKSYLGSLLAAFAGPGEPLNLSYPTTSEEATKAMLAALIGKPAVISFDDMQTDWLPHGMINRMLTSETVADRLLGSNSTKQVGTKAFVMGTGNNVSPVRDMCRRVVTIALRPQTASPATMKYNGSPVEKIKAEREHYVALALTVIRAWMAADQPKADVPDIATFGAWSVLCRQPLIWLGEPDPATSLIEQVQNDPDAETFGYMMLAWYNAFGSKATTLRKVINRADGDTELKEAIMDLPVVERGIINRHKFGWFLKKNANRIVNGMFVRKEASSERNAWSVQLIDPARAPPPQPKTGPARAQDMEEIQLPDGRTMINGEIF